MIMPKFWSDTFGEKRSGGGTSSDHFLLLKRTLELLISNQSAPSEKYSTTHSIKTLFAPVITYKADLRLWGFLSILVALTYDL